MVTMTAVIILNEEQIFIWAIPPLSPQPPDFFDHHPTYIPPLFIISLPDDIEITPDFFRWTMLDSWYFGSSQPLYCDLLDGGSTMHRFRIMIEPDFSTASLHLINAPEISPHDFTYVYFQEYMVCEDTLVSCFMYSNRNYDSESSQGSSQYNQIGLYTGLTTNSCFANGIISRGGPAANMLLPDIGSEYRLFPCPASGRFVRVDNFGEPDSVAILDFF